MSRQLRCFLVSAAIICLQVSSPVCAEEGGTGHYVPGSVATLIDTAPTQPGWVLQPLFLHYEGSFDGSKALPVAGVVSTGLDVSVDSITLGSLYSLESKVMGATYSAGVYFPFVSMDVTGSVDSLIKTDSASGLGDITVIPAMLAWKSGNWQYTALLPVYTPTGEYEMGQLANLGVNYWTLDPTFGLTYANETSGLNAKFSAGITFNSENNDTNYDSGSVLHSEMSLQKVFPSKIGLWGLGANAFLYEQISGDSGEGASNGDFKGRTMGIGPVLDYILPTNSGILVFELKWLPEMNTKNRVEGDYVWFKAAWQF